MLIADPVIQAIGRPEFEDGLRTGLLLAGCLCHCVDRFKAKINSKFPLGCGTHPTLGVRVGFGVDVVFTTVPLSKVIEDAFD